MFPPIDDAGQLYRLKAMNCPMHNEIFRSRGGPYRELPLRFFEFGTVYRNEKSACCRADSRALDQHGRLALLCHSRAGARGNQAPVTFV